MESSAKERIKNEAERILGDNYVVSPPIEIDEIAANYGLELVEADFNDYATTISGFIDGQSIFVNEKDSTDRQAVTVAVLLARFILYRDKLSTDGAYNVLRRIPLGEMEGPVEEESLYFAANLLIPENLLEKYKDHDANNLAKIFGVPADFLGYRLELEFGRNGAQEKYA
ncbi:MAG: ImmA/IrrE family metallo-endopeptidase [Patescibacteria group bacterium]